ncbi:TPA: ferredoxin family protein [Escherichia coli]|nr:ferredoxin family protein [Escherichia coli]
MSVARNLWRVADAPHIVPADSVERQTAERLINACPAERLINACPAGLFSLTPEGNLRIDYRSCLECGTCRLLCDESTLQQWRYSPSGFGITYRFG